MERSEAEEADVAHTPVNENSGEDDADGQLKRSRGHRRRNMNESGAPSSNPRKATSHRDRLLPGRVEDGNGLTVTESGESVEDTTPSAVVATGQSSVEDWAARISEQVGKSAQSLVLLGQLFIDAKSALQHGQWEDLFQTDNLRFRMRTAQKLMQVAKNATVSNAKNSALLPPSLDALATLARLDAKVVQEGIDSGAIRPDLTIAAAKKFALDQRETQTAKADKPFVYEASLRSLVNKVSQALDKVPDDQRGQFCAALVEAINGSASATA
jgi:hypothetical protein